MVWYFIFRYIPMYGLTLAFKQFRFDRGIIGSEWIGLRYLTQFLTHYDFWKLLGNTFSISILKLIFTFPAPVILALMLNEIRYRKFKRAIQTVSYLPYFVSWVVVVTLFMKFLTPHGGPVNDLKIMLFGGEAVYFMGEKSWFYTIVIFQEIWKKAVLTTINPELYEALHIDGGNKWNALIHITLPALLPVMGILFILTTGNLMRIGFEQIYLLQNPAVLDIAEILDTYALKEGIRRGRFSYASAVTLFQSVFSLILIIVVNKGTKKATGVALW